jgi:pimeloyl-ACP methyl ester carboxylesterase
MGRWADGVVWPMLVEHRVRVAGDVVAYGLAGEGPPVVMIHGLGGSSRCWA